MNIKALQRVCPWEEDAMAALQYVKSLPTVRQRMAAPPPGGVCLSSLSSQDAIAPDLSTDDAAGLRRWLCRFPDEQASVTAGLFCVGKTFKDVSLSVCLRQVQQVDSTRCPGTQRAIHPRLLGAPVQSVHDVQLMWKAARRGALGSTVGAPVPADALQTTDDRALGLVHVDGCMWAYTLAVLDLDAKDPACIPYYYHQDAIITQVYLESLGAMPPSLTKVLRQAAQTSKTSNSKLAARAATAAEEQES
jgi:hypothetical protein